MQAFIVFFGEIDEQVAEIAVKAMVGEGICTLFWRKPEAFRRRVCELGVSEGCTQGCAGNWSAGIDIPGAIAFTLEQLLDMEFLPEA